MLGLGGLWVNEQRAPDEYAAYRAMVDRAILATADPRLTARLRLRRAADARHGADGSKDDVRAAVDELRRLGDPLALAHGLSLAHHTLLAPHDTMERAAVLDELVEVAARAGDPLVSLLGLLWTTIDAFLAGRPDAMRSLQRLRARADEMDHDLIRYVTRTIEVMALLRAGHLEEAEATLDDVRRSGQEVGERDADNWFAAQLLELRWFQGRAIELAPAITALADSPVLTRPNRAYLAATAALAAEAGDEDGARVALAGVAPFDEPPHGLAPSCVWMGTMCAVVEAYDRLDAGSEALLPFAHLPMMSSFAVTCAGSTHRALGVCARTMGDQDLAIHHLERAVVDNLRFGNRPMLAMTRADLADALLTRAGPDDAAEAAALYEQALSAADQLGMTGWAERWRADRRGTRVHRGLEGSIVRNGEVWEVRAGEERALVAHSVGMAMLATLLSSPSQDISVAELTGAPVEGPDQPVLDEQTRRAVRRRLEELQADIDHADADADIERASRLRVELDQLVDELTRTTRLGGRSRSFSSSSERARTSVQKAIRRALDRIGEQAPDLARGLTASIRTGTRCRFEPVDGVPRRWQTSAG